QITNRDIQSLISLVANAASGGGGSSSLIDAPVASVAGNDMPTAHPGISTSMLLNQSFAPALNQSITIQTTTVEVQPTKLALPAAGITSVNALESQPATRPASGLSPQAIDNTLRRWDLMSAAGRGRHVDHIRHDKLVEDAETLATLFANWP
ncbi:MAG TPA: hypothetical protein VGI75_09670, partial [Pirellulales bacterium]